MSLRKAILWLGGQARAAGELALPEKVSNDEERELVVKYLNFFTFRAGKLRGSLYILSEVSHGIEL